MPHDTDRPAAVPKAASRNIADDAGIIRLSAADQRQIAEAMMNPPDPTPELTKAFQRQRELFGA